MKKIYLILTVMLLLTSNVFSAPFDTGFIEWEQPNGTTFVARSWGDEFFHWMETEDGYRIIIGPEEYFYYAVLDARGEFYPSEYKVGIDETLESSYQLERSQQRISELETAREEFYQQIQTNFDFYIDYFQSSHPEYYRIAVVLVDFADNLHYEDYNKENFDTLFFSKEYYHTDVHDPIVVYSPDDEDVFGSLRDYFIDQSLNKFDFRGEINDDRSIINPPDQGNPIKPEWIYMDEPRYYYDNNYDFLDVQLMVKDQVEHYLDIDLDEYNAICFVYAGDGNNYSGGTALSMGNDKIFTVSEKHINTFLHIGLPAHVFCNVLGAMPQFFGTYDPSFYSLMSYGYTNGTEEIVGQTITKKGSCPAAFDPPYRIFFDWVDPIEVEVPVYNLEIQFNYSSPKFYKVNILNSDEYFLLERRDPSGFHKFTPWEVNGYNDTPGILIWHVAPSAQYRFEIVELQYANNIPPDDVVDEKYLGHKFPYPNDEEQIFNDVSVPDANKRNGEFSFLNFRTWNQMVGNSPPKPFVDITLDAIEVTNTVTWSENMYLSSPVFIKNGGILNIIQGADITIVGDYIDQVKIVIEDGGTLNLTGLENNKVILQTDIYENPIIEWKGIEIYGSGTLVSNYAMIKNAIKPIYTDPTSNPSCSFYNTKIIDNTSELRGNITIDNSIFIRAPLKIYYSNSNSSITKSVFSLNDENEIAVYLVNPETSYLKVLNCTFNDLDVGLQFSYDPVSQWDRTNQLIVRNNIFSNSNHSIEIYDGSISISFNDFFNNNYNNYPGNNYLEVNPLYVNPGNSNFNLQWGSGCIDAGHTSPVYNDPDGTRNDMGAKFYDQSPVTPTNFTVTPLMDLHPLLQWEGAPHLDYIVYAHYDYLNGTSTDNEYLVLTESYVDETVVFANPPYNNQTVTYSVTSVNSIGDESSHSDEIQIDAYGRLGKIFLGDSSFIPTVYNLFNPYPNPFNPTTTIVFDLPEKSFVSIKLYSITGEEIRTLVNEEMRAGRHPFLISGNDLSSGVYLLRMVSNKYVSAKKLILMK